MTQTTWVPPSTQTAPVEDRDSPFWALDTLPLQPWLELRTLPAEERRQHTPGFPEVFPWEARRPHLPLPMAPLAEVPPWSGRQCRSQMRCHHQNPRCFGPVDQRACAAQAGDHPGCACDTSACRDHCCHATPRDPDSTYVYYSGSHQPQVEDAAPDDGPGSKGKHPFGYKSKAFNGVDDRLFTCWSLSGPFVTANRNDHLQTLPRLRDVRQRYPQLKIGEVLGDAGVGHDELLRFVHQDLHPLCTIPPRHHAGDKDDTGCLERPYDGHGVPLCVHGYRMHCNGHNYTAHQTKWVCRQRCRLHPQPDVHPDPLHTRPD